MPAVKMPLDPVVGRAVAVALQGLLVEGFRHVEEDAGPQHTVDAVNLGAMRVVGRLALCVVLAVNGGPFLRDHPGGEPEPEAEEMRDHRMKLQRAMRLAAV